MAGPGRARRELPALAGGRISRTNLEILLTYRIALAGFVTALSKLRGPLPARQ
jgi:hypothetical protein